MIDIVISLLTALISILPASPISGFLSQAGQIDQLAILNWFIPFDIFIVILETWAYCIGIYYIYRSIKEKMKH